MCAADILDKNLRRERGGSFLTRASGPHDGQLPKRGGGKEHQSINQFKRWVDSFFTEEGRKGGKDE